MTNQVGEMNLRADADPDAGSHNLESLETPAVLEKVVAERSLRADAD